MFQRLLEAILWNSRLVMLVPVLASMLLTVGVLVVTTVDAVILIWKMVSYLLPTLDNATRDMMRPEIIHSVFTVLMGYLLTAVLLILALGLYELFINKIHESVSPLLQVRSLDDFRDRLAHMILLIIVIKFFQMVMDVRYVTAEDLIYLAVGITLVTGALYLSRRGA